MGKKNSDEKFSVLDQKSDKPTKLSSSRANAAPKASSYIDDTENPPCDEEGEEDEVVSDEKQRRKHSVRNQESQLTQLDLSLTVKKQKKLENKERIALVAAEIAKKEALNKDDRDAFTLVMGRKTSVLEGEEATRDANVKDITITSFSVSVRGQELLKNASVTISHGKRYGFVGPNGMGKTTLLKLLAWRKLPVPKNIDILLVHQEFAGDGTTLPLEAVVSANEEFGYVEERSCSS